MLTKSSGYTPTAYSTVGDKIKFEKQFKRFVESGFKRTLFPKWFYKQLSMCFSHIAHYNQNGFYATWFMSKADQIAFLKRTATFPCYGSPEYTYSDVELELRHWVKESGLIEKLTAEEKEANEAAEYARYMQLKAKYEPTDKGYR